MNRPQRNRAQSNGGNHVIGYAYPDSDLAARMHCSDCGCYYVEVWQGGYPLFRPAPFDTRADALDYCAKLGTTPLRWSIDHPANKELAK